MDMIEVVDHIFKENKGILAADESGGTIEKRLASVGIESTSQTRHLYRHTLFSTQGMSKYIGGVILFDETIRSLETTAPLRAQGINLGIKVDTGAKDYGTQKITEGLDGLTDRLSEYRDLGASFAKWRAVLTTESTLNNIKINCAIMSVYAKRCQEAGIVPIVEPEVLMDGIHTSGLAYRITGTAIRELFAALERERVNLETLILKPNMIVSGYDSHSRSSVSEVAYLTLKCFKNHVPAAVGAIAFLSGGQKDKDVLDNLACMNEDFYLPWTLSFSFGRTMQNGALRLWAEGNPEEAKDWTLQRAKDCCEAVSGRDKTWGIGH